MTWGAWFLFAVWLVLVGAAWMLAMAGEKRRRMEEDDDGV